MGCRLEADAVSGFRQWVEGKMMDVESGGLLL
jgi:hypothetical protein